MEDGNSASCQPPEQLLLDESSPERCRAASLPHHDFDSMVAEAEAELRASREHYERLSEDKWILECQVNKQFYEIECNEKARDFLKLCSSISKGNDVDVSLSSMENMSTLPFGYAKPLGKLLRGSPLLPVSSIMIDTSIFLPGLVTFSDEEALAYVEPLVDHVHTSSVVQRVTFRQEHDYHRRKREEMQTNDSAIIALLNAAGENPNIQNVDIACSVPSSALAQFLSFHSLTALTIYLYALRAIPWDDHETFAFATAKPLNSLRLTSIEDHSSKLVVSTLKNLTCGRVPLRELQLAGRPGVFDFISFDISMAIVELVRATTILNHVLLENVNLCDSSVFTWLDPTKLSTGIAKVTLRNCLGTNFTRALVEVMQTRTANGSALRELHGLESNVDIARMLSMESSKEEVCQGFPVCTIGSQRHTLTLHGFSHHCSAEFVRLSRWIRLPCLKVHLAHPSHCLDLDRCLSKLTSDREVHISTEEVFRNLQSELLGMVRTNGNLCVFSVAGTLIFAKKQWRQIQAYCQRNQCMIRLIEHKSWKDGGDNEDTIELHSGLYPMLLRAARVVPQAKWRASFGASRLPTHLRLVSQSTLFHRRAHKNLVASSVVVSLVPISRLPIQVKPRWVGSKLNRVSRMLPLMLLTKTKDIFTFLAVRRVRNYIQ